MLTYFADLKKMNGVIPKELHPTDTDKWYSTGWEKVSFHSISKKSNGKECSNYDTTALILRASKTMLEIPQARLQQYMNQESPDVQARFRKGRGIRDQIANISLDHGERKGVPEKHLLLFH